MSKKKNSLVVSQWTSKELQRMSFEEASEDVPEQYIIFIDSYCKTFNADQAAQNAGLSKKRGASYLTEVKNNKLLSRYMSWVREQERQDNLVEAHDIINQYTKIAFADTTDFVKVENGRITIKDTDKMDGRIVKSISKSVDGGIKIELHDKMKSLDSLMKYYDAVPLDIKDQIALRKLAIEEEKLQILKDKMGSYDMSFEDDGFINAIKSASQDAWVESEFEVVEVDNES